jgi:hypothetical protein
LEEEQRSSSPAKEEPMDILPHIKKEIGKKLIFGANNRLLYFILTYKVPYIGERFSFILWLE